jgi:hypothetical protein
MCFADARKEEMMMDRHSAVVQDDILAIVAAEWRNLDETVRASWDERARDDKVRYVREKAEYKGPWTTPKRRAKKHPHAPRRPMSAFLKYSQNRRAMIKEQNPDMGNTDVSRLLGEMWRNASEAERRPYIEQELVERAEYNETMKKFREEQARRDVSSRTSHREVKKLVEESHGLHTGLPSHITYDALVALEPLYIHSADEAAKKVDERESFNSHPIPYHDALHGETLRQAAFFGNQGRRGDQPVYHHQAPVFRPDKSLHQPGFSLSDSSHACDAYHSERHAHPAHYSEHRIMPGGLGSVQDGSSHQRYKRSRTADGPFSFADSSFYHYP